MSLRPRFLFCGLAACSAIFAQTGKVDFRRDVQPLLKANCVGCHGPTQQMANFRLDRRRDAMRGGTFRVIMPGSGDTSRLYLRLTGTSAGMQMPPTGALPPEKVAILRAWIDQGAEWPDDLSGETPAPPPHPGASRLMDALRNHDRSGFQKLLRQEEAAGNRKGPGGSTPLMYATLYGEVADMRLLLDKGADVNTANDAGATALMWAVDDLAKTRLLLDSGANVNARSSDGRTPLLAAAARYGTGAVIKLLLEHGADPNAQAAGLLGGDTPLALAAMTADEASMRLLVARGADPKASGPEAVVLALRAQCAGCVDLLTHSAGPDIIVPASILSAPPFGPGFAVKSLVGRGGDPNAKAPDGLTLLMHTAASELLSTESIQALVEKGADVNARSPEGLTALDFARKHGKTPAVELLLKSGAQPGTPAQQPTAKPSPAASVREAVERSLPLVQSSDAIFLRKAGCVSCHNNSFTAIGVAAARGQGLHVDEEQARRHVKTVSNFLESWRERALLGVGIPGDSDTVSVILVGLAAENYPADAATDAMARFLKGQQHPSGQWLVFAHRPPIEIGDIPVTVMSMRALQLYAPKAHRAAYEQSVKSAAAWLEKQQADATQDRAMRLLGLAWAGVSKDRLAAAARELIALQRPDGGWAQLPTLASDAYATGQALAALRESGALLASDKIAERGADFLLKSQMADGSWYVRSRAIPLQPYFESGFPYGHDQWISNAATDWAARGLIAMLR